MLTLSYGYKKPEDTDDGSKVFPATQDNIQKVNDHTHNGTDSAPLASQSLSLAFGSWVAVAGVTGRYRQLATLPAGYSYDTVSLWFTLSTGEVVHPAVEKVSASTFYVYTTDNTLTYVAHYR